MKSKQVHTKLECPDCSCTKLDISRFIIIRVLEHVEDGKIMSTSGESYLKDKDKHDHARCTACGTNFLVEKDLYDPWELSGGFWGRTRNKT